jgi:hypothetical protein
MLTLQRSGRTNAAGGVTKAALSRCYRRIYAIVAGERMSRYLNEQLISHPGELGIDKNMMNGATVKKITYTKSSLFFCYS